MDRGQGGAFGCIRNATEFFIHSLCHFNQFTGAAQSGIDGNIVIAPGKTLSAPAFFMPPWFTIRSIALFHQQTGRLFPTLNYPISL